MKRSKWRTFCFTRLLAAFRIAVRTPKPAAEAHDDNECADYAFRTADNEYRPDLQSPDDTFWSHDKLRFLPAAAAATTASLQLCGEAHADRLRSEIIAVEPRYRCSGAVGFSTCPRRFLDVR